MRSPLPALPSARRICAQSAPKTRARFCTGWPNAAKTSATNEPAAQPPAPAPSRTDHGSVETGLSADKAAAAPRTIRPATATDALRPELARELLTDLRRIDAGIKSNEAQTRDALAASATTLQEIPGVGAVLAAKILGHVGDITRFPSTSHFASYKGTAPLDASSGNQTDTGSTPEATGRSTRCCTPWRSAKAANPAQAATTT